ncbi:hypothetical protein GCM10025771_04350 [Niveibacterium umoris]|uniref:Signal transduction histidine kinase n=1 Tax=Niveibacterium umoris TaxID=1193620 RepID=A0A840BRD5_9RHOO|nr:histidine kinase [Niveibacterium umoris]MBB4014019.1 signal transduction histidine kinase [Niveibacterium umoris]
MTDPKDTRAADAHKRVESWISRTTWSSLLLLGFGFLILHRIIGVAIGMRAGFSVFAAVSVTVALFGWKLWLVGPESLKTEFRERWQRLSEWLAVVGWWRLIFVSIFVFAAAGIAADSLTGKGEVVGIVMSAILILIAAKIARGAKPRSQGMPIHVESGAKQVEVGSHGIEVTRRNSDGIVTKQVKIGVDGISANRGTPDSFESPMPRAGEPVGVAATRSHTWLQGLTWGRLLLLGLLLLIAAGVANTLVAPDKRDKVVTVIRGDHSMKKPALPPLPPLPKAGESEPVMPPELAGTPDIDGSAPQAGQSAPQSRHGKAAQDVKVGPRGIEVVERDENGKVSQHVKIGLDGIKVTDGEDNTDVEINVPELRGVPGISPEKAQEIEDRIRDEIEAATERAQETQRKFDFAPLAFLVIVSLAIMKLLAGGKRRAELDAGSARIAADMARLEREAADAKLHAMQAQIEPHFLFNTLASVDQLIRTDPQRASQVQKTLIQYLRAAIPQMRDDAQRSTLGRQVKMSQAYLEIMQVRMEERLAFSFDAPEGLSCAEFPSMMLQTLIENCIKHGLEPKPEGGRIDVKAEVARGKLRVKVSDTGVGFTADAKDGVGLANIRERLRLLYGNTASLTLTPNEGGGTVATIELPYRDDDAQQTKVC